MRWPWQRERPEPGPQAQTQQPAPQPTVPPAGWAFLPPLQRTIGTMELAHGPDHFARSLSAWGNPSFTGTMSHLVTADAPPGVIDVDGGGTGAGEGYRAEPADMTLLLPPAPSRPAGGLPTAVQRASSADDAPYGASSAVTVPDDIGELPVEPAPTPVVGFQPVPDNAAFATQEASGKPPAAIQPAAPVQRSAAGAQPSPAPPQAKQSSPQPADFRLAEQWDVAAAPRDLEGSTSDGNATYVPLPAPRAVQRSAGWALGSPPAPQGATPIAYPSRLGLGRPLSFSAPESSERPPQPASEVQDSLWPVQRVEAPALPLDAVSPLSSADLASASGPDAMVGSGADVAAPEDLGPSAPRTFFESPAAEPREAGNSAENGTAVRDGEGPGERQPLHVRQGEDGSAPLLSDVVHPAAAPPSEDSGMGTFRPQGTDTERTADLPVVSRFPAAEHSADNGSDGGPAPRETAAALLQPDHRHDDVAAGSSETAAAPKEADRITASERDETPVLKGGLLGDVEAAGLPAHNGFPVEAGIPVQSVTEYGEPGATRPLQLFAGTVLAGLLPAQSTPRGVTGATEELKAGGSVPPDAPSGGTVQRADQAVSDTVARSFGLQVGHDTRASRPATPGSTPLTWQRMAMPPSVQQPSSVAAALATSALTTPGSYTYSNDEGTGRSGADSVPGDRLMVGANRLPSDFLAEPGSVYHSGAAVQSEPAYVGGPNLRDVTEPPGPNAAVGSVIQRTLTLDSQAARPMDGSPWPGMPFRDTRVARPSPGSGAPALQRMPTFPGPVPVRTARYPMSADLHGTAGRPVVDFPAREPVVLTLAAPTVEARMDGQTGHGHDLNGTVQRDSLPDPPDAVPSPAAGQVTAPLEVSGASSAAEAPPAGPAPPAAERSAGTPGVAGAATPDQLEELAKRLAGPLIRRIKAEMLLDRERRGLRTDPN